MEIQSKEIKRLFFQTAKCSDCGSRMEKTLNYVASSPPQFEYKCVECGKTEFSTDDLPRWSFEFVEEAENG